MKVKDQENAISELKSIQKRLAKALQEYQLLVDAIEGIVWEADSDFRFTFVSKQAERLLGYPTQRWLSEPDFWKEHIHPDDRDWAVNFCLEQTKKCLPHDFEYRFIAADGRTVWLRDLVTPVRENSHQVGIRGIMVDITQTKKMTEDLSLSEQRFRGFFEQSPVSTQLLSHDGKTLEVNSAWKSLWKIPQGIIDEYILKDYNLLQDLQLTAKGVMPFIKKGFQGEVSKVPEILYDPTEIGIAGDPRWVEGYIYPVKNGLGQVREVVLMHYDITDRKNAEAERDKLLNQEREARIEAQKAIKMRDDFISIASHELRTPLTPLKMQIQLLKKHVQEALKTPSKLELLPKTIENSEYQVDRLVRLVEATLDVSSMMGGKFVIVTEKCDLSKIVRQTVELFSYEFRKHGCTVILNANAPVTGCWDRQRIEQVISNLLTNAIKYGRAKPIEVSVYKSHKKAIITVKDHGIGIIKEDQDKIFGRFVRVASLKNYGGLGLGLFITRKIVEAHEGTIHVESDLDQGSTFTVELPLKPRS